MFTFDTKLVENGIDKNLSYSIFVSQESINTEKSGVKNVEVSTIVTLPVFMLKYATMGSEPWMAAPLGCSELTKGLR